MNEIDLEQIKVTLKKNERVARLLPMMRWMILAMGLFLIAIAAFTHMKMEEFVEQSRYASLGLDESEITVIVEALVNIKHQLLKTEIKMYLSVVITGTMGLFMLILPMLYWRGNPNHTLTIQMTKHLIESHEKSNNT